VKADDALSEARISPEGYSRLERIFSVDLEWTSWMLISDESMGRVAKVS